MLTRSPRPAGVTLACGVGGAGRPLVRAGAAGRHLVSASALALVVAIGCTGDDAGNDRGRDGDGAAEGSAGDAATGGVTPTLPGGGVLGARGRRRSVAGSRCAS